jgi:hypothetical protein
MGLGEGGALFALHVGVYMGGGLACIYSVGL